MQARLPLLDADECAQAVEQLQGLERHWTHRHDYLPSYTLGAAAYLDVPRHGIATYTVRAVRMNKFLRRDFGWLHQRTAEALADHLGEPVGLTRRFATPGFHIFRHHPNLGELKARLHFDLQAERLDFDASATHDPACRLSFTTAVALPEDGAGLYIWPLTHEQTRELNDADFDTQVRAVEPEYQGYTLGELFVHDGSHLHSIASDRKMVSGESRVTYQGHAIRVDGEWQLYW